MNLRANGTTGMNRSCVVHVCTIGLVPRLFLIEHFRRMRAAGFDVVLACCDDADARFVAQQSGARLLPVPIAQGMAPVSGMWAVLRLWLLLRRLRPAIVDAHGSKAGLLGSLVARLAGVPIRIYHNHGMAMLSASGLKRLMFRCVEWLACRCASRVIYVAPSNLRDAVAAGVCPPEKAVVLGPGTIGGLEVGKFDPALNAARGTELRRAAGIPDGARICGFVGRIVPHKGIETLLEAWRLLPETIRENAYLCIFGSLGTRRMYDLVHAAESRPELHVKYLGFTRDLPAWYTTMTLLVQPSWHEGWGYNVLEAACSGVPAVGTRISATVDAILDGVTGLLVPVQDPPAMAAGIVRLLSDSGLRDRLAAEARGRVLREFTEDAICPLLIEEYRRLLVQLESGDRARVPPITP